MQKQNRHSSRNAKLFIFLLWLVMHNCVLLATVFIIEVPILNFAQIFSGVSCHQSFLAVMPAVIMFSKMKRFALFFQQLLRKFLMHCFFSKLFLLFRLILHIYQRDSDRICLKFLLQVCVLL